MKKNELNKIGLLLNNYANETDRELVLDDITNVYELANVIEKIAEINNDTARAINGQLVNILDNVEGEDSVIIDHRYYSVEDVFKLIITYYNYYQSLTA